MGAGGMGLIQTIIHTQPCPVPVLGRWCWSVHDHGWYDSGVCTFRTEAVVRAYVTLWSHRVLMWMATRSGALHLTLRHHIRNEDSLFRWGLPTSHRKKSGR